MDNFLEIMRSQSGYAVKYDPENSKLQEKAKRICYEYNKTAPDENEKRAELLKDLLGTYNPMFFAEQGFRCDYGFNIHAHGFAFLNYNCTILDTSPVHIGDSVFIAPGVCLACPGHAIDPEQRKNVEFSKPITISDDVWIGANVTVCGGVTIGKGSVIGAGSVVNRDIPENVVAAGVPCRVIREITEDDIINFKDGEMITRLA